MKRTKTSRELGKDEIASRIAEARLELSKEKGASEIGTAKNPGRIKALRRSVARMLTIRSEKGKSEKQGGKVRKTGEG